MQFPKRRDVIAILTALSVFLWGADLIIRRAYGQTGCLVIAAPRQVKFSFTVTYDPTIMFPPERGVRIYRSLNKAPMAVHDTLLPNVRDYADNTLTQGNVDQTYEYYATVWNDDGESLPGTPTLCVTVLRVKRPPPAPIMGPLS